MIKAPLQGPGHINCGAKIVTDNLIIIEFLKKARLNLKNIEKELLDYNLFFTRGFPFLDLKADCGYNKGKYIHVISQ